MAGRLGIDRDLIAEAYARDGVDVEHPPDAGDFVRAWVMSVCRSLVCAMRGQRLVQITTGYSSLRGQGRSWRLMRIPAYAGPIFSAGICTNLRSAHHRLRGVGLRHPVIPPRPISAGAEVVLDGGTSPRGGMAAGCQLRRSPAAIPSMGGTPGHCSTLCPGSLLPYWPRTVINGGSSPVSPFTMVM